MNCSWSPRTLFLGMAMLLSTVQLIGSAMAESSEYLFVLKGRGNVFWQVIRQGIEETARARGIEAVILNTDDDQTPEAQLNMCLASLARKPRVLVMGAATKNVGIECYKKAVADGIRIADIDSNVTVEDAKAANLSMAFMVGSDNVVIGREAARYLISIGQQKPSRILVIKGLPGSIVSENRTRGFLDEIKMNWPAAEIVGTPSADWDRMKGMNTATDFMLREPELDYIYSVSDAMTMGIIEAVRIAGRAERIKVVSVDGIKDGRKAVLDGRMAANVAQLPYLMGKRAVELSIMAVDGEVTEYTEFTPTPLLTAEVLKNRTDPNLQYLR